MRKVDTNDYHDMLDWTEERFVELFEKYPDNKELIFDLRGILRFYQLCMNLILAKADKNSFFVNAMLKTMPKEKSLEIIEIMQKENIKACKKILEKL